MPPKAKYSKEEIVSAAYELAREKGIDAVVAREVGRQLGTTPTPIFTIWNSMDELRLEVKKRAEQDFLAYMKEVLEEASSYKEFGMRWIKYACMEPNLYQMLFYTDKDPNGLCQKIKERFSDMLDVIIPDIMQEFGLVKRDAEILFDRVTIFANGIATFMIIDKNRFTDEYIKKAINQVCLGLVFTFQLKRGAFSPEKAKKIIEMSEDGLSYIID